MFGQPEVIREERNGRGESTGQVVRHLQGGGVGGLGEGERESGRSRGGRRVGGGVREGSEEQPLQDLESDELRHVFPAGGESGRDPEDRGWHENSRRAVRRR